MANDWNDRRPNSTGNSSGKSSGGGGTNRNSGAQMPRNDQSREGQASGRSSRGRDISDFSLGIDRSNDQNGGDWFQSPYQPYSQPRNEGWGAGSRGFSQNPNYTSYSAGLESGRESYAGRGPKNYRRSDERITEDVGHELEQHHEIDASQIEVVCEDGIVTLKGHVEDRPQKRMAEHCIEHLPGVKDVRNELIIDRSLFDRARDFFMGRSGETSSTSERNAKSKKEARKRPM